MNLLSKLLSRRPTIFVQIASYRDPECQWTVKDLFAKATHPERVRVGICWQYDPEHDQDCFKEPYPLPRQVRERKVHASQSRGVCWARYEAQQLYRGEDYVLMIDSHMRFVPGWDELMLAELQECPGEKPILTSYPPGYTPPDKLKPNPMPTVIRPKAADAQGDIRGDGIVLARFPKAPLRGAFLAAGFLFASGRIVKEVPYDPYMYFNQEEISLGVRLFTHGWDIFHPGRILLYHYYTVSTGKPSSGKSLHWEDHTQWKHWQDRASRRFHHLVGHKPCDDADAIKGLKKYGLGKERTLAEYEAFAGIDFTTLTVLPRALNAEFIDGLEECRYASGKAAEKPAAAAEKPPATAPAPATEAGALQAGHYLPPFQLPDQSGALREIQLYAGKPLLLFFLPIEFEGYIKEFTDYWREKAEQWAQFKGHILCVVHGSVKVAKAFADFAGAPVACLADADGALFAAFGHARDSKMTAFTVFADNNLKITRILDERNARNHLAEVLRAMPKKSEATRGTLIRQVHAPLMVIPEAISPALAGELLQYWQSGKKYDGVIGVGEAQAVNKQGKRRVDADVRDRDLLARIDAHLAKSMFPEIRKVGGVGITCRERYKIGRYGAEEKGYYHYHRDTGIAELAYRRYSVSIALNEGFEGGLLAFPEYGQAHYAIAPRTAVVFPSTLLHGITPVTQGERFVLVSFLFGAAEEAFRKEQTLARGEEYNPDDVALLHPQPSAALDCSEYYYTRSKEIA